MNRSSASSPSASKPRRPSAHEDASWSVLGGPKQKRIRKRKTSKDRSLRKGCLGGNSAKRRQSSNQTSEDSSDSAEEPVRTRKAKSAQERKRNNEKRAGTVAEQAAKGESGTVSSAEIPIDCGRPFTRSLARLLRTKKEAEERERGEVVEKRTGKKRSGGWESASVSGSGAEEEGAGASRPKRSRKTGNRQGKAGGTGTSGSRLSGRANAAAPALPKKKASRALAAAPTSEAAGAPKTDSHSQRPVAPDASATTGTCSSSA